MILHRWPGFAEPWSRHEDEIIRQMPGLLCWYRRACRTGRLHLYLYRHCAELYRRRTATRAGDCELINAVDKALMSHHDDH